MKSLKELFRIGHGPSSSHTMGPGNAAILFRSRYPEADRFRVVLYGSLAATGKGHFTDLALKNNLERPCEILWKPETILPRHPNGMEFTAWNASGETLGSAVFYSVGGGAIEADGASGSGEREKE
ncbi:MAG: serine dehydratase, partial [Lentisphaeria bacterium]|nr:serine dehydratase [Lentisphaeria bacterium]